MAIGKLRTCSQIPGLFFPALCPQNRIRLLSAAAIEAPEELEALTRELWRRLWGGGGDIASKQVGGQNAVHVVIVVVAAGALVVVVIVFVDVLR